MDKLEEIDSKVTGYFGYFAGWLAGWLLGWSVLPIRIVQVRLVSIWLAAWLPGRFFLSEFSKLDLSQSDGSINRNTHHFYI